MRGMEQGGPHPTREELERFIRGKVTRQQARAVVRHLLTECPECLAVTRRLWRLGKRPPALEALLGEMLAEADARAVSLHDEPGLL